MEFLVEFELSISDGVPDAEVRHRKDSESVAAAKLVAAGHLVRLWTPQVPSSAPKVLGLHRAESCSELEGLLGRLPLAQWMEVTITPLAQHPNDPASP